MINKLTYIYNQAFNDWLFQSSLSYKINQIFQKRMIKKSFKTFFMTNSLIEKRKLFNIMNQFSAISNQKLVQKRILRNNFSTSQINNQSVFVFNAGKEPQLLKLQLQYREQQNVFIFEDKIKASTSVLEQMNIFKIFKVLQSSPFNEQAYQEFFNLINKYLKRKSDNILLLLATIKERIARSYQAQKNYGVALKLLEEALNMLQECMIPQLLPYYSVYREYGLLLSLMGEKDKAKEVLTQSVNALNDFVSHSDDDVSTDHYCLKQATAYNALAQIDLQNSKRWVEKALQMWQNYGQNKCSLLQYAKTVANNLKLLLVSDKEKGEAYYHFNFFKFQTKEMKDLLKQTKASATKE